jgi:hypothetical protein
VPNVPPLRLGNPELDDIVLGEPDLGVYDQLGPDESDEPPDSNRKEDA